MTRTRYFATWVALRLFIAVALVLYPIFAIAALPWAWFASLGQWGHTPLVQLREETEELYNRKELLGTLKLFFSREIA